MRPFLVLAAHGLDLATFLIVVSVYPVVGEWNHVMGALYLAGGVIGVIALKGAGAVALTCLSSWKRHRWFVKFAFIPATLAGLVGAAINTWALSVVL